MNLLGHTVRLVGCKTHTRQFPWLVKNSHSTMTFCFITEMLRFREKEGVVHTAPSRYSLSGCDRSVPLRGTIE